MNWPTHSTALITQLTNIGLQVVGAILLYIVGRMLINVAVSVVTRGLHAQKIDATVMRFIGNTVGVVLNITLVVALLGYFGVQTTTFAALLAAVGLAIGTAWGGLLANFAAGIFLIVLQPFKVGDFVTVGGVTGTVIEIGLFVTTLNTPDNIKTFIGNGKVFGDNIENFSANPYRRVDLSAQISGQADPHAVIAALKERMAQIPNVMTEPAPEAHIHSFTLAGPVLAVRPFTHTSNYWQVYFDTNMAIREVCGGGNFPAPMMPYLITTAGGADPIDPGKLQTAKN
jgi:small conductance mechanosensitive channel